MPKFVVENLDKKEIHNNIFSNQTSPYNPCYFKTLWTKYKRQSKLLEENQTLYSFRHTGAINVYLKTESLIKLRQIMGHSSLNVTITYLRGLGVVNLNEDDMPSIS